MAITHNYPIGRRPKLSIPDEILEDFRPPGTLVYFVIAHQRCCAQKTARRCWGRQWSIIMWSYVAIVFTRWFHLTCGRGEARLNEVYTTRCDDDWHVLNTRWWWKSTKNVPAFEPINLDAKLFFVNSYTSRSTPGGNEWKSAHETMISCSDLFSFAYVSDSYSQYQIISVDKCKMIGCLSFRAHGVAVGVSSPARWHGISTKLIRA